MGDKTDSKQIKEHESDTDDDDNGEEVDPEEKARQRKSSEQSIFKIVHCDEGIKQQISVTDDGLSEINLRDEDKIEGKHGEVEVFTKETERKVSDNFAEVTSTVAI